MTGYGTGYGRQNGGLGGYGKQNGAGSKVTTELDAARTLLLSQSGKQHGAVGSKTPTTLIFPKSAKLIMLKIDHLHNERKGLKGGTFVYTRKQACHHMHMTGTRITG